MDQQANEYNANDRARGATMRFQLQQMTLSDLSEKQRKAKVNGNGGPRPLSCVLDSAQSQQLPDKLPAALKEVGQSMLEGVGLSLPQPSWKGKIMGWL